MIRHTAIVALEVVAGLLAVTALLGGIVAWRLLQGPLRVDALTPYVEQALNQDSPVRAEIGRTELSWAGFGAPLDVRAVGVVARGTSGDVVAAVPELRLQFSLPALLQGRVAVSRVELVEPYLNAIRTTGGAFRLDIAAQGVAAGGVAAGDNAAAEDRKGGEVLAGLLAALRRPPDPLDPMGALTELSISNARLTVDNRETGGVWAAPRFDLRLTRDGRGLKGTADLDLDLGGRLNRLSADIDYALTTGEVMATTRFKDLRPADFAQITPVLGPLAALDVALSGSAAARFSADMLPTELALALEGGAGRLVLPDHFPEPREFRAVRLTGRVGQNGQRLDLDDFTLDFGGPVLSAAGNVRREGDQLRFVVRTRLEDLPMDALARYWPATVASKPRFWMLRNMKDGRFDETVLDVAAVAPADNPLALSPTSLTARFALSGFTVHYKDTLPPVTGVGGTAVLNGGTIDIDLTEGRLLDLVLQPGTVRITGLDMDRQSIDIDIPLGGPVSSVLTVLDHPPLGYAKRVNLVPAEVGGTTDLRLRFAFPLIGDLKWEQVVFGGEADLRDVTVGGLVPDIIGTEGAFTLKVDGKGLVMDGTARLNGVPSEVTWEENFPKAAEVGTRVRIRARLDDGERARFKLDFPDWLNGPVGVDMTYERRDTGQSIDATLDLEPATLRIDLMEWRKEPGLPGQGTIRVEFVDGRPVWLPRFAVRTGELEAEGRLRLRHQDYGIDRLELDRFKLGAETDASIVLTGQPPGPDGTPGGQTIRVSGASFDARPLRRDSTDGKPDEDDGKPKIPLDIGFDLDRVVMGDEGQALTRAVGDATRSTSIWTSGSLEAVVGAQGTLRARYFPDGDSLALTVDSDDAGAALAQLDILGVVRGGTLSVIGRSDPADPKRTVSGTIDLQNYQVQDAPVLARLLSAASPQGFAEFLGGQPLSFSRLQGTFHWHDRGISFREVRTSGNAVGLTAEGDIDVVDDRADLQGTIVPFSLVNRLLGAIPLVGDLLVGGEGQGIFAATYRLTGPLDDLQSTVNPLAVLAPGFLRNLFFLPQPAGEAPTPAPGRKPGTPEAPTNPAPAVSTTAPPITPPITPPPPPPAVTPAPPPAPVGN